MFEQVSPQWRALCLQYKFEYLLLESAKEWEALPSLIEQTKPNRQFSAVENVGVCIRRLELLTSTWTDEKESGAIRLLKRCPNLQILLVGSFGDAMGRGFIPDRLLEILFASSTSKLHALCFRSPLRPRSVASLLEHLPDIKAICSLSLRFVEFASLRGVLAPAILKDLHSLEIFAFNPSDLLDTLTEWKLPALRRVSLREQQIIEDQKLFSFFLTHGTQLKILEMDCLSLLAMCVLIMCPNVTDIITDIRVAVGNQLLWHPAVQRIGFRRFYMVEDRHV